MRLISSLRHTSGASTRPTLHRTTWQTPAPVPPQEPYSFSLPSRSSRRSSLVVYDVPPGLATPSGSTYSLNISGACIGSCPTPNQVPVAKCKNVTVSAGANCTANASVDDGSFDPDGDPITITQSPAGPYPQGTTNRAIDRYGSERRNVSMHGDGDGR